ncbi:MAG: ABC transporter ATP-binding protein [Candidatus Bipolaricaulota bacterium]
MASKSVRQAEVRADVVLRTEGLVKDYGAVRALDGVDLEVHRGEVFGFVGPNGAGKTTAIRILLDLLRPTAGKAEVLGLAPAEGGSELRRRIGYLPGELRLSEQATARELLGYYAGLRNGSGAERIKPLARRFGLKELDRPIRTLSEGNKQKIGIVQAFIHEPELLILDEPSGGLDPLLQRELLDLVLEAQGAGATVFMSSHVLSEVEAVAGRVAVIRQGRIVDTEDVRTLRHRAGQNVEIRFAEPVAVEEFRGIPGVKDAAVKDLTLTCLLFGEPDALLKAAARHHVVAWSAQLRTLEELFLDYYRVPNEQEAADAR